MNATIAREIAASGPVTVAFVVPRGAMVRAFVSAATAYCVYLLRTHGTGTRNADHVRILAADVVLVGRQMDAMGHEFDEEALLHEADVRAYSLVHGAVAV
jgi:hypothetical protein